MTIRRRCGTYTYAPLARCPRTEHSQTPAAPRRFAELSRPYWMAGDSPAHRLDAGGRFEPGRGIVPDLGLYGGKGGAGSRWRGDS